MYRVLRIYAYFSCCSQKGKECWSRGEASMREWGERKGEERERIKLVWDLIGKLSWVFPTCEKRGMYGRSGRAWLYCCPALLLLCTGTPFIRRVRNLCDKSCEFLFTNWLRPTQARQKIRNKWSKFSQLVTDSAELNYNVTPIYSAYFISFPTTTTLFTLLSVNSGR